MSVRRTGPAISRSAVVRDLDRRMIEEVGVPSAALMESAGRGVADAIVDWWGERERPSTLVLCGPGNNGGDGYVIARHLAARGWFVRAVALLPPTSPDCRIFHAVCAALGLVGGDDGPHDLVIDAVFGTGQRAPLAAFDLRPGWCSDISPIVAVDVPTGIDADTGERIGAFPQPVLTVTIGRYKPGLFRCPGEIRLVDIGLELVAGSGFETAGRPSGLAEALLVGSRPWIPPVQPSANKWERGHVGIRAGSPEMAGAGVLAALGALHGGAGLVTLFTPRAAWPRVEGLAPEVMLAEPGGEAKVDALVVGPGLGRAADEEVRRLWREFAGPAVFDADGLRALDGTPSPFPRILTPHAGEAAALIGAMEGPLPAWRDLEADRLATTRRLAALGSVIYKGACPVVSGSPLAVLDGRVPALGTGGSGDVLAGLCGALLANARGAGSDRDHTDSVALAAAWLHLEAGRRLPVGASASEIARAVATVRAEAS